MHLHFWLACEFFIFIVFCRNGLTSPSKWASRIRFNGTDCSYWIIFLPLQRVCHRMKCLITFLNLYSRKTRSGRFYLESRTWQTTFYHKIWVCKQFQGDCRFLTTGQEYEGNALLLFKCWNLGSLLGKRIPHQMLSISQSIPGIVIERERDTAEVYHKLGDDGRQIAWWYEHSFKTVFSTVTVWVLGALMIYSLYFLGNSRCYVQYQSQSHSPQPIY